MPHGVTAAAAVVFLATATTAFAGRMIVTSPLRPPSGGSVRCIVVNASPTKNVRYTRTVYEFNGSAAASPVTNTLGPNQNLSSGPVGVTQGHCAVEVLEGGKRNVRVTLQAQDSGGNVVAAVEGR